MSNDSRESPDASRRDSRIWSLDGQAYDPFATPEPEEEWAYVLANQDVVYGKGPWPFFRANARTVRIRDYEVTRAVRRLLSLEPNTLEPASRTHKATLIVGPQDRSALATLEVFVSPQGSGGIVQRLDGLITLPALEWSWRDPVPVELVEAANRKQDRVMRFLRNAVAERDCGIKAPTPAAKPRTEVTEVSEVAAWV